MNANSSKPVEAAVTTVLNDLLVKHLHEIEGDEVLRKRLHSLIVEIARAYPDPAEDVGIRLAESPDT